MRIAYLYFIGPVCGAIFFILTPLITHAYNESMTLVTRGAEIGGIGIKLFILLGFWGLTAAVCGYFFHAWAKQITRIFENCFSNSS